MTPISKLKQSEYKEGAKLSFENFEDLIKISENAARIENYGAASALSVLAMEELSKSVILQFKAINNLVPIKNLEKYFKVHETKQKAAIAIFSAIESKFGENDSELSAEKSTFSSIVIAIIALLVIVSIMPGERKPNQKDKSLFDTIKETGFYVGYDERTRHWISPKSIHNEASYNALYKLINDFAINVKTWIFNDTLNKGNIIEFLKSLDDDIIDKNGLNKLK